MMHILGKLQVASKSLKIRIDFVITNNPKICLICVWRHNNADTQV